MYLQFFGLKEVPFAITPDPAFVYLSPEHREALAHLLYGVGKGGSGGFVQLTGEVGTGKTTLCRCLLEQLPEDTHVALVLNPLMTPRELLATICEELGIDTAGLADSNKGLVDTLNAYLLEQHGRGHRVVVVIDEAQNLSPEALEQVRLLTNLETPKEKLLQMVLLGQPELRRLLQRQNLRQLSQRITARYHLQPLDADETRAYVRHRMMVAGAQHNPFGRSALRVLHQRSGGVPRLINIIADRALAGAYARESLRVNGRLVHAAANEVQPSETRVRRNPWPGVLAGAAGLALVVVSLLLWGPAGLPQRDTPAVAESGLAAVRPETGPALPPAEADTQSALPTQSAAGAEESVPVELLEVAAEPREEPTEALDAAWLALQHVGAWDALAGLWNDPSAAAAIRSACEGRSDSGYACLRESGNWSRIRQLGLPVVLVLRDGGERLLPLLGIGDGVLLVGAAGDSRRVDRAAVEERWFGEYLLSWPQAADWPLVIREGETGPAVDIVMQMAAYAEPPWQGEHVFDARFETWLTAYQERHGLDADGIVGPNTLIHLMAPTIDEPRLIPLAEEER